MLALVAVLAALIAPAAHAAGPQATASALAKQMRSAGSSSGALVVDLDSGEPLLSVRADVPRVPASVEKLFTTSTALLRFGPEGVLTTRAAALEPPDEFGVLWGDLWVLGGGDPTFGRTRADDLAAQLLAAGVTEVSGAVVGDESAFDARRGPAGWGVDGWVGPLSALTYNHGYDGRRFAPQPAVSAARAVRQSLKRAGIAVTTRVKSGIAPDRAVELAAVSSPPMATLARLANTPSDNFIAEMLIKALGRAFGSGGSTSSGTRVIRGAMSRLGVRTTVVDGSGLSRSNRTSPRQVVALLRAMKDDPSFVDSLAIAGRTGTLLDRMRRNAARDRCRAKTGSLIGVSALAGYCTSRTGARTAFAFLMNNVNIYGARTLQDRMASALAKYAR
jgi:D-alanyl-D-alanine carboxypeptidase/D-alanyl-D-alanine-endopeptidase (penicillin-binding protein 4)